MLAHYQAAYHDSLGEEQTIIQNDGKHLHMLIRGVEIERDGFFALADAVNGMGSFRLQTDIPVFVIQHGETIPGTLHITAERIEHNEGLYLELKYGNVSVKSHGEDQEITFDEQLLEIEQMLPTDTYLKVCHTCALSDYHRSGSSEFGHLACFRGNKEAYRMVENWQDLARIWRTKTEYVQETYLCEEFEKRRPKTGFRG